MIGKKSAEHWESQKWLLNSELHSFTKRPRAYWNNLTYLSPGGLQTDRKMLDPDTCMPEGRNVQRYMAHGKQCVRPIWAHERWRQLEAELTTEWEFQGWGDRTAFLWLSNHYEGWERVWAAAGAVPRDVELIIGKGFSPQVHSRKMKAANRCANTAGKFWEERNTENEAWISSIPELSARKAEARRKPLGRSGDTSRSSPKPRE